MSWPTSDLLDSVGASGGGGGAIGPVLRPNEVAVAVGGGFGGAAAMRREREESQ